MIIVNDNGSVPRREKVKSKTKCNKFTSTFVPSKDQWLRLAHVLILVKLVLMLGIHELLRPFCLSFTEVFILTGHVFAAANKAVLQSIKRGFQPKFPEWTLCIST
ncbi:hypothetical protein PPTG_20345 [Plasmopara halstedii]|uniref:Uncharacterized protein n=1 Tax=Plasmopara halstedii TaxID=4781 RepID=A0A0P1B501_PLAHL|nr:hypothetical protein PPTG_20345 [Plasmopara halstedii]CEG49863.1 hypothetical protein PPTG_20345 [Plasmopara halstedii]|eukprot:XP_024586232.1 hypothetical protein PPTG_20345 [Plasmopara halstedii]